ncbi:MAG: hypothetical protein ACP5P3_02005 [Ignavibacteria bacterium]
MKAQTSIPEAKKIQTHYLIGLLMISLSVLSLEFTYVRIMSVSLWYHFAFMIISVALLGLGISGVTLSIFKKMSDWNLDMFLYINSVLFSVSILFGFVITNKIPLDPFSLFTDNYQFIYLPLYYLLLTLPFLFAGMVISRLIYSFQKDISKIYFFDLIGAGMSSVFFVLLVKAAGGNGMIFAITMCGLLSAAVFGYRKSKLLSLVAFILSVLIITLFPDRDNRFEINSSPNKIYANYIKARPDLKIYSEWNAFSKVDVMQEEEPSPDGYDIYLAIIDNGNATTNIPRVKSFPLLAKPADASNLAFITKNRPEKVFILGSGGGGEVLVSLYHNADFVKGVEINGILNELIGNTLSYWTGPLIKNNDKVKIVTDDARGVLRSEKINYDVIISAHTISASAVSSGAMSLVENYILTREAITEYINHLQNDGVLYISRPETQIPKLLTTLRLVNKTVSGSEINNKIVVFRRPPADFEGEKSFLAGVVYKKNGFSPTEVFDMRYEASQLGLELLYDPMDTVDGELKHLITIGNLESFISDKPALIPATDDSPFFDDNFSFFKITPVDLREVFSQNDKAILALKEKPVAQVTLLLLLIQIIVFSSLLLIIAFLSRKNKTITKSDRILIPYFACLGLAYIMLQVSLIQKFTLFLGNPAITMITVISAMLIASGIGSFVSEKLLEKKFALWSKNKNIYFVFIFIFSLVIIFSFTNAPVFKYLSSLNIAFKIMISSLIIVPLGFMMGIPFPYGIKALEGKENIPIVWAVNGFFSIIGTVITVILAMMVGFKVVFIIAGAIYLFALLFVNLRLKRNLVY